MKKKAKQSIIGGIIAVVAAVVTVSGTVALVNRSNGQEKLNAWDYEICRLDDATGKKDESDKSGISTKNFLEFDKLISIDVKEDAGVKYYVNAYDADKKFLQVDEYTADWTADNAATYGSIGAVYYKLEIVDVNDKDQEINLFEKSALAGKVEVTVSTETSEAEEK